MFHTPKKALFKPISRRKFLELGGGVATALGVGSLAVGLNSVITRRPVYAYSSDEAKWRQYEGSKLVFMSENTPPSFAIRDNIQAFYDLTGIEVEILTDGLPTVQQKVGIDLRSGQADYHLNYVQDKPIGSPFADFYADLNQFSVDDTLPLDPQGYGDDVWFENFLDACGVYYERGPIRAFPYDCAVSCTFYRQDLFEQLTKDFEADYGYRLEFTDDTTYKNMVDIAEFFRKMHERDASIPYGYAQHHGSFGWTTQLDIQRHMYAQNQWLDFAVDDTLGSKNPGPTNWGDAQSVSAMEGYKALADVSHPDNLTNGTLELNTVYAAGGVAMQIQYHEFAASVEDPEQSVAAGGKTGLRDGAEGRGFVEHRRHRQRRQRHQLRHRRHRHQRRRVDGPAARGVHLRQLGLQPRNAAHGPAGRRRHADPQVRPRGAGGQGGAQSANHHAERAYLRGGLRQGHPLAEHGARAEAAEVERVSRDRSGRHPAVHFRRALGPGSVRIHPGRPERHSRRLIGTPSPGGRFGAPRAVGGSC